MAKEKKEKKPKSKVRKIIEWVLTGLFVVIFAVAGIAQIDGLVNKNKHHGQEIRFGYAAFVVVTESMEPKYMVDSATITYLEDVDKIYERYQNNEVIDVVFYDDYTANNEYTQPVDHPELTMRTRPSDDPSMKIITHRVKEIHVNPALNKGEGKYTFIVAGINTGVSAATDSQGRIYQYQVFTEEYLLGRVVVGSPFLGGVFKFVSSVGGLLILLLIPSFYLIIVSVIDIFKAYKEPDEAPATANGAPASSSGELSEEDKKRLKEELLQEMMNKKKGE